jgi:hypothetical protein
VTDHDRPQILLDRKAGAINSSASWLEENRLSFWRSAIDAGHLRSIKLIALICWKPKRTWDTRSAMSRFATALWEGLVQQGVSKLPAIVRAALTEAKAKTLVRRNREEHYRLVAEYNQVLETYRIGLEAITPIRRLNERELVVLLYRSFNPADGRFDAKSDLASLLNTDWSAARPFRDASSAVHKCILNSSGQHRQVPVIAISRCGCIRYPIRQIPRNRKKQTLQQPHSSGTSAVSLSIDMPTK